VSNIHQCQIQKSLNILSLEEKKYVLPEIWTRDRNQAGPKVPPIHLKLKHKGDTLRRVQPISEGLLRNGLLDILHHPIPPS
jgi:hypothetical protein